MIGHKSKTVAVFSMIAAVTVVSVGQVVFRQYVGESLSDPVWLLEQGIRASTWALFIGAFAIGGPGFRRITGAFALLTAAILVDLTATYVLGWSDRSMVVSAATGVLPLLLVAVLAVELAQRFWKRMHA